MTNFIGSGGDDVADAQAGVLAGFSGGTITDLRDEIGDVINGREGNDYIRTGGGSDYLLGGAGVDILRGMAGDDLYVVDRAEDQVFEEVGGGFDEVRTTVSYTLAAGQEIERVMASPFDEIIDITGNEFGQLLFGNGVSNRLIGAGGDDVLVGGTAGDYLDGGEGFDTVSYLYSSVAAIVDLNLGITGDGDLLFNMEAVFGSPFADSLIGRPGVSNRLDGENGDDIIVGEGIDTIIGGGGNDAFFGGQGGAININLADASVEIVWGSVEADMLDGSTSTSNLVLVGQGAPGDTLTGGQGDDFIYFRAGDIVDGGVGLDWAVATLSPTGVSLDLTATPFFATWGSAFDDVLDASARTTQVVLVGDAGNDVLTSGSNRDFLYGLAGDDTLRAGIDFDNLVGGEGVDRFVFDEDYAADTVWDWEDGVEKLDVSAWGVTGFNQLMVDQNYAGTGHAYVSYQLTAWVAGILLINGGGKIDASDFIFA